MQQLTDDRRARAISYIQHQASKPRADLVEIVAAGQAKVLDVMGTVDDERARCAPGDGEWCMRELMLHVIAAEGGVAALLDRIAAGTPVEVKDPSRAVGMQLEDDGAPYAALVERLEQANARMLEAIRALPDEPNLSIKPPHPFFGDLNCWEWAGFQRLHDEDHAQHARKILEATA